MAGREKRRSRPKNKNYTLFSLYSDEPKNSKMNNFLRKISTVLFLLFIVGALYMIAEVRHLTVTRRDPTGIVQYFTSPSNESKANQCGYWDYRMKTFFETYSNKMDIELTKPLDTPTDKVMLKRYLNIEAQCPKGKIDTPWSKYQYTHTIVSRAYKFSICYVPKIGCTFWKTLIHILETPNITSEHFTSKLMHTDKILIHLIPLPWLSEIKNAPTVYRNSKTIVFARDPYSRLLSAYNDKFLLPAFSEYIGKKIIKLFRPGASDSSLECGHDVTFKEFLRYVIYVDKTGDIESIGYDDHYAPVTSLCDVCETKYDFIGKHETFSSDRDYIFQQLGLDKLTARNINNTDSIKDSINQTVSAHIYHFKGTRCFSHEFMKERIWRSLQLQGYVPYNEEAPWRDINSEQVDINTLSSFLIGQYEKYNPSDEDIKQQRHQALVDAYKGVPLDVKREIQAVFHYDFKLFDYEKEPLELFNV